MFYFPDKCVRFRKGSLNLIEGFFTLSISIVSQLYQLFDSSFLTGRKTRSDNLNPINDLVSNFYSDIANPHLFLSWFLCKTFKFSVSGTPFKFLDSFSYPPLVVFDLVDDGRIFEVLVGVDKRVVVSYIISKIVVLDSGLTQAEFVIERAVVLLLY